MSKAQTVCFAYDQHTGFRFPDVIPDAGDNLPVLGESGFRKTTLQHLIASLPRPKSGRMGLIGTVLHELSSARLNRFRGRDTRQVFKINISEKLTHA